MMVIYLGIDHDQQMYQLSTYKVPAPIDLNKFWRVHILGVLQVTHSFIRSLPYSI